MKWKRIERKYNNRECTGVHAMRIKWYSVESNILLFERTSSLDGSKQLKGFIVGWNVTWKKYGAKRGTEKIQYVEHYI